MTLTVYASSKVLPENLYESTGRPNKRHLQREVAHNTLLQLVSSYTPFHSSQLTICYHENGAPFISVDGQAIGYCSISHSCERVLVAFSNDVEIGVDLEWMRDRNVTELSEQVLTEKERAVSGALSLQQFYQVFCAKEAWAKANGKGLLQALAMDLFVNPDAEEQILPDQGKLVFERFEDNYMAAIYSRAEQSQIKWVASK